MLGQATEEKLIETSKSLTLYQESEQQGRKNEDEILLNDAMLDQFAVIWNDHEDALRVLVRVINADLIKYMVESAMPVEIVGLRHELQGAEKILTRLARYAAEKERRVAQSEDEDEETPVEDEPATPAEGEEGSL